MESESDEITVHSFIGHFMQCADNLRKCALPLGIHENMLYYIAFRAPYEDDEPTFEEVYANFHKLHCYIDYVRLYDDEPNTTFDIYKYAICSFPECPRKIVDIYIQARMKIFNRLNVIMNTDKIIVKNYIIGALKTLKDTKERIKYMKDICSEISLQRLKIPEFVMIYDKLYKDEVEMRIYHAKVKTIQNRFRIAVSNPRYPLCQKRLMHEFAQLCIEV